MKVLLTAINAKYIHSNLAVYSLKSFAGKYGNEIEIAEFTINNYTDEILKRIYKRQPDVVAFSCYIWNIEMVLELVELLNRVLPGTDIWLGGPEVSYDARTCLVNYPHVKGIMRGEGEETFLELMAYYHKEQGAFLEKILGLTFRDVSGAVVENPPRPVMDMSRIPFVYDDLGHFKNKIIYYESSRGCPFSCSYCLSSIDKKVRFRDMEMVKAELLHFIKAGIPQVKFVDRTFNCSHLRAREIWTFLRDNDLGRTNFHFEVAADLMDDESLEILKTLRPGLIQLEIGVQSTCPETIHEIRRTMDFGKVSQVVGRINEGHNIHQHLDLIAGLPYENLERFRKSFDDVYALRPDQLQLGFLKVLKGSYMHERRQAYGLIHTPKAPYEVLSTQWMDYGEIIHLKSVEEMVEVYYNSHQFDASVAYLEHFYKRPIELFEDLAAYYEAEGLFEVSHSRMGRYDILRNFVCERKWGSLETFQELLIYDLYLRENLKSRPSWSADPKVDKRFYLEFYNNEEDLRAYLTGYDGYDCKQIRKMTHVEHFTVDIKKSVEQGRAAPNDHYILFDYKNRDPLTYESKTVYIGKETNDKDS